MRYHVYLQHGTSVYLHLKSRLESGPVTTDLTTTVLHTRVLQKVLQMLGFHRYKRLILAKFVMLE